MAFAPDYARSGARLDYVDRRGRLRVDAARRGSARTRRIFIGVATTMHHGQLQFGPDGLLYVSTGMGSDPDSSQDVSGPGGKILRVDPRRAGAEPEVVALGLRTPWRFSFDRRTGLALIGDVGENRQEEVDVLDPASTGPANFGWPFAEGRRVRAGAPGGLTAPALTHAHGPRWCSIVGGYVVRGREHGLRQQLRAGSALERCTRKRPRPHFGPQAAPGVATRAVAGVSRPRRRLAQSARAYGLRFPPPKGLDHGLAYEAIAGGQVDVIDIYTTDAKLDKYQLTVLEDDLGFFPRYDAVLLYRADVPARFPKAWAALAQLESRLDNAAMRRLNAAAELDGKDFAAIASDWLSARPAQAPGTTSASDSAMRPTLWQLLFAPDFGRLALEHVGLVFTALAASCAIGIPLGLLAARRRPTAPLVFGVTGVIQTIPSLALLAFLIPLTGRIGLVPAFIALTLYALLPIVRNTQVGLTQIPRAMIEAAESLGLRPATIMRKIELPLAMPTLLAGIKTSAVVNVGTATIAAFIGAGGFGERIVTGLALNDQTMLLAGAIPVAVLALAIQGAFELLEKRVVPAGLQIRTH